MKLCFIGSGIEIEKTNVENIEIYAVARAVCSFFDTLIYGGSKIGLMQSFAQAFRSYGGKVISVVPDWLEQEGLIDEDSEVIRCLNLAERKQLMFSDSDAILCYPGGLGTLDELFEVLAHHAVDKTKTCPPIYLYNWEKYFSPLLLQLETADELGLIHSGNYSSLQAFETVEKLLVLLQQHSVSQ